MPLIPLLLPLWLPACGDAEAPHAPPPVVSVQAPDGSGLFAFVPDPDALLLATGEEGQPAVMQWRAGQEGAWTPVEGPAGSSTAADTRYWLPAEGLGGDVSAVQLRLAVGATPGEASGPIHVATWLSIDATQTPLLARDNLTPTITTSLAPMEDLGGAVELQATLQTAQETLVGYLDRRCVDGTALMDCWSDSPPEWVVPDLSVGVDTPTLSPTHEHPGWLSFTVRLLLDAVGTDGRPTRALIGTDSTDPVLSVGRRLYWGDLHAHSNLSHDGCEDWEEECGMRGDYAAQDFFQNARQAGLDFVAITDHAEWDTYYPDGVGGAGIDIWEEQKRLATAADGPELVTLLGYEYTNYRTKPTTIEAGYEGGHKTVIFEQLDVHPDFRIGAERDDEVVKKGDGSAYTYSAGAHTNDPTELTALLDAAADLHGPQRLITFFHHSALDNPQGVDFRQDFNLPDPRYEPVLEMNSEHGSSECVDIEADWCDFNVQETIVRLSYGSVQFALSQGQDYGFVSGTDCHDSRPGSTEDGPGWHGSPNGQDSVLLQQYADGGVTGAFVAGPLDRVALFDAIFERATLSSSGPRVVARVLGVDDQGRAWLPGATLPADATTLTVQGSIDGNGAQVDRVQLVDRSGAMVADSEGKSFSHTVALSPGAAFYVRVILTEFEAGEGSDSGGGGVTESPQRTWLSPFFVEAAR
ncbi:DUF3604 domain-containing protein [Myxococcota bacterium]|nr:DUF3604 domain-containing protein [Myxococcota bacterium]